MSLYSIPPKVLYRYRPSGTDYFEEEVRQLRNNGIFLTPAAFLNDPFDCSPAIEETPLKVIANAIRDIGVDKFRRFRMKRAKASGTYPPDALKTLRSHYRNSLSAAKFEAPIANNLFKVYKDKDLLVSCLSEVHDSVLMWSHYAESHKGFVVEYHSGTPTIGVTTNALPLKVNYVDKRPKFTTIDIIKWRVQSEEQELAAGNIVQEGLYLTKSSAWEKELEWRLVEPRRSRTGYYNYSNLVPMRIIVGARMSDDKVNFIRSNLPNLDILRAVPDPVSYALGFEEIF